MAAELGPNHMINTILGLPADRICVDGIRAIYYAIGLRVHGARLIAFDCEEDLRDDRILLRGSPKDDLSREKLKATEEAENRSPDLLGESTLTVMEYADYRIDASQPVENVLRDFDEIVVPMLTNSE
jgi:hypothetical protein